MIRNIAEKFVDMEQAQYVGALNGAVGGYAIRRKPGLTSTDRSTPIRRANYVMHPAAVIDAIFAGIGVEGVDVFDESSSSQVLRIEPEDNHDDNDLLVYVSSEHVQYSGVINEADSIGFLLDYLSGLEEAGEIIIPGVPIVRWIGYHFEAMHGQHCMSYAKVMLEDADSTVGRNLETAPIEWSDRFLKLTQPLHSSYPL